MTDGPLHELPSEDKQEGCLTSSAVYMCTTWLLSAHRGEKRGLDPQTGVRDSFTLMHGCWEPNPGPVQEQEVLLTMGLSLQPQRILFLPSVFGDVTVNSYATTVITLSTIGDVVVRISSCGLSYANL